MYIDFTIDREYVFQWFLVFLYFLVIFVHLLRHGMLKLAWNSHFRTGWPQICGIPASTSQVLGITGDATKPSMDLILLGGLCKGPVYGICILGL